MVQFLIKLHSLKLPSFFFFLLGKKKDRNRSRLMTQNHSTAAPIEFDLPADEFDYSVISLVASIPTFILTTLAVVLYTKYKPFFQGDAKNTACYDVLMYCIGFGALTSVNFIISAILKISHRLHDYCDLSYVIIQLFYIPQMFLEGLFFLVMAIQLSSRTISQTFVTRVAVGSIFFGVIIAGIPIIALDLGDGLQFSSVLPWCWLPQADQPDGGVSTGLLILLLLCGYLWFLVADLVGLVCYPYTFVRLHRLHGYIPAPIRWRFIYFIYFVIANTLMLVQRLNIFPASSIPTLLKIHSFLAPSIAGVNALVFLISERAWYLLSAEERELALMGYDEHAHDTISTNQTDDDMATFAGESKSLLAASTPGQSLVMARGLESAPQLRDRRRYGESSVRFIDKDGVTKDVLDEEVAAALALPKDGASLVFRVAKPKAERPSSGEHEGQLVEEDCSNGTADVVGKADHHKEPEEGPSNDQHPAIGKSGTFHSHQVTGVANGESRRPFRSRRATTFTLNGLVEQEWVMTEEADSIELQVKGSGLVPGRNGLSLVTVVSGLKEKVVQLPKPNLAVCFCLLAGASDAAGFLGVSLFTSHVTGNYVVIGAELAQENSWNAIRGQVASVGVFFLFAMICHISSFAKEHRRLCLIAQIVLLLASFFVAHFFGPFATSAQVHSGLAMLTGFLVVGAMGVQNVFQRLYLVGRPLTCFMTGNSTQVAMDLVELWNKRSNKDALKPVFDRLKVFVPCICCFLLGCVIETALFLHSGTVWMFLPPPFIAAGILVLFWTDLAPPKPKKD
jgi:uncharacterized membrane protein YoaK (UPF0700 family)